MGWLATANLGVADRPTSDVAHCAPLRSLVGASSREKAYRAQKL